MSAAKVLTQRWPSPAPECFLSTTDRRVPPRADSSDQRDVAERVGITRVALGPVPQSAGDLLRALDAPQDLQVTRAALRDSDSWDRPASDVRVEALPSADGERVRLTGTVPRALAIQLAVSDETLPPGDPVVMSFTLSSRGRTVTVENAYFHFSGRDDARRERVYAFAESRAVNQTLGALLAGASQQTLSSSPALARAHRTLGGIAAFEEGPEPGAGATRVVHRAARLQRAQAYAIARVLGPIYDCGVEPRTPSMVDEPRERPIAQAFLAAALVAKNLDPALLYAVATDAGLHHEVETWHRGIADIDVPDRIDGERTLGLTFIADEAAALRRDGYLPSWFGSAIRGDASRPELVPAGARSALTNALTFVAARLAYSRDRVADAVKRLAPNREVDQRALVFLTLLHAEGGDVAVQRYLQDRRQRPMLPAPDEARGNDAVARALSRTAIWEQMQRTGVFERAP